MKPTRFSLSSWLLVALCVALLCYGVACSTQTIAELVTIGGQAVSAVVAAEGNSTAGAELSKVTTAAAAAVNAWKPGTPSQNAVQAITAVVNNLDLIPDTGAAEPLLEMATATYDGILSDLQATSASGGQRSVTPQVTPAFYRGRPELLRIAASNVPNRHGKYHGKPPKSAKEFKAAWNKILADAHLPVKRL